MSIVDFAKEVLGRELISIAAISPLLLMGLRKSSVDDRWRWMGWSLLFVILTDTVTGIHWLQPSGLHWNWSGKALCIVTTLMLYCLLPFEIRTRSGLFSLPARSSTLAVVGFLGYCLIFGLLQAFAPQLPFDAETLAFQLVMPSLAEEPVYRGILPALLSAAMESPWKIAGARLGWWWLAICAYFGLGHAIGWTSEGEFHFDTFTFIVITIYDLPYGWIAVRSGSIWPAVVGHSLNNSTCVAIGLLLK